MAILTITQSRILDKIPKGWQKEQDLYLNIKGERDIKNQLFRMAEKGFLEYKLENSILYYKK